MKDIVLNKDSIKNSLSFYGLFIMVYEQFFNEFYNRIYNFFADDTISIIDNEIITHKHFRYEGIKFTGDLIQDDQKKKLEKVFHTHKDLPVSMYIWMSKYHLITKQELKDLIKIKNRRNEITHQLFNLVINEKIIDTDKELFDKLIKIRNNAFHNWIKFYELIDDTELTVIPSIEVNKELVDRDNFIINLIKDIINKKL